MLSQKKRVLIVDDEESVRQLLRDMLESDTIEIVEATDGDEALEILTEQEFDLIITDMRMSRVSGYDLLLQIRRRLSSIPVILITGEPAVEAAVACMKLGGVEYITKPFDLEKFEQIAKKKLSNSNALSRPKTQVMSGYSKRIGMLTDYEIVNVLSEGNMGSIFIAQKCIAGKMRKFALKILKTGQLRDNDKEIYLHRFINEARAATAVRHPNIVSIVEYDITPESAIPYLVMEYVDGLSLKHYIRSRAITDFREKAIILRQIASALSAIHDIGICHRDIKPENVLVDTHACVKLTDFGIAKLPDSDLTMTTELMGSPVYLSPEAFKSAKVDHRSDIFAFGTMAYELLTGQLPFTAGSFMGLAGAIRNDRHRDPLTIDARIPIDMVMMVDKSLEKHPDKRYQNVADITAELDGYIRRSGSEQTVIAACSDAIR